MGPTRTLKLYINPSDFDTFADMMAARGTLIVPVTEDMREQDRFLLVPETRENDRTVYLVVMDSIKPGRQVQYTEEVRIFDHFTEVK